MVDHGRSFHRDGVRVQPGRATRSLRGAPHRRGCRLPLGARRSPSPGRPGSCPAGRLPRRGHLPGGPQHQLHQRLRHRLSVLCLLPTGRTWGGVRAGAGRDCPQDRGDRGPGGHPNPDAGRSQPRPPTELVRGAAPVHPGALSRSRHRRILAFRGGAPRRTREGYERRGSGQPQGGRPHSVFPGVVPKSSTTRFGRRSLPRNNRQPVGSPQ